MKVMQVMLSVGEGGPERHFINFSTSLGVGGERGRRRPGIGPRQAARRYRQGAVVGRPVAPRSTAAEHLARLLRSHRPDVVHAQANKAA